MTVSLNCPDTLIASIRKNTHQELRILIRTWKGAQLVDCRLFVPGLTGEMRPTKDGAAMPIKALPEIVKALQAAEAEARKRGLLSEDGRGP
jgi:hypothetical protein